MGVGGGRIDVVSRVRQFRPGGGRVYVRHALPKFEGPLTESFRCFFLCGECGWLDAGAQREPYREAPGANGTAGRTCPYCQNEAWVDLNDVATAAALRESDERHRLTPAGWARRRSLAVTGGVGVMTSTLR